MTLHHKSVRYDMRDVSFNWVIQGIHCPISYCIFNQVFNENPGYKIGEWRAGGRAYPKWRQTEVSAQ